MMNKPPPRRIPVGISQCALGDPVRYNGGHKRSEVCTGLLSRWLDLRPYCPEVAIGMGVPRPPIHLVMNGGQLRALGRDDVALDVTDALLGYADRVVSEVSCLRGFILMQKSPSCGVRSTPRYLPGDPESRGRGAGLFAARLHEHFPALPMEEVGRLNHSAVREHFLTRVSAYDAWHRLVAPDPQRARVQEFFSAHKYLLLAHHQDLTRELGRQIAQFDPGADPAQRAAEVLACIMHILARPASREGRTNALMHSQGHLREFLSPDERAELTRLIEDYRRGLQPLSAVISRLRHYLPRSPHVFIHRQVFLAQEAVEWGCEG